MNKELKQHIAKVVKEEISIVPYNPKWPSLFEQEKLFLLNTLPSSIIKRIEHFGSTAVSNLSAKPIIDILVEVSSLEETKKKIVSILAAAGYEYFWRPEFDENKPPYYAWFIKRDAKGNRTHHIHMVEADSKLWDRLYFRDYLREFPEESKRYDKLKKGLSKKYPNDRVRYTKEKSNFILSLTKKAKEYYI